MLASQLDVNENIILKTSTSTNTSAHTVPVIEGCVKLKNKSPEEIKKIEISSNVRVRQLK